jgi:hypothetical protein
MDRTQPAPAGSATADGATPDAAVRGAASARTRRDFLRAAGAGGAAMMIAACAEDPTRAVAPGVPNQFTIVNGAIQLDFSQDIDVVNYAYALEQLEAAFYTQVVANAAFTSIFPTNEQIILRDLRDHEVVHRDFFSAAIVALAGAGARIPNLTVDFSSVNFANRASVLTTARTFEDLGVGAYNGAGRYFKNAALLTVAGKIVSVEARHAAAIRDLLNPRNGGPDGFAPAPFDPALPPAQVLAAADPFIVENITVINA